MAACSTAGVRSVGLNSGIAMKDCYSQIKGGEKICSGDANCPFINGNDSGQGEERWLQSLRQFHSGRNLQMVHLSPSVTEKASVFFTFSIRMPQSADATGSACAPGPNLASRRRHFTIVNKRGTRSARRTRSDGLRPQSQQQSAAFSLFSPLPSTLSCGLVRPSRHGSPRNRPRSFTAASGEKAASLNMSCAALCLLRCRHLFIPFFLSSCARYFRREFFSLRGACVGERASRDSAQGEEAGPRGGGA